MKEFGNFGTILTYSSPNYSLYLSSFFFWLNAENSDAIYIWIYDGHIGKWRAIYKMAFLFHIVQRQILYNLSTNHNFGTSAAI